MWSVNKPYNLTACKEKELHFLKAQRKLFSPMQHLPKGLRYGNIAGERQQLLWTIPVESVIYKSVSWLVWPHLLRCLVHLSPWVDSYLQWERPQATQSCSWLCVVPEKQKLKNTDYPLIARILQGPCEQVSKVFLMEKDQVEEVTYDVSPFSVWYLSQKGLGMGWINDNWVIAWFFCPTLLLFLNTRFSWMVMTMGPRKINVEARLRPCPVGINWKNAEAQNDFHRRNKFIEAFWYT